MAFSSDGKSLATASNANDPQESGGEAKIWDVQTGKELRRFNIVEVLALALSSDGKRLATVSGRGTANEINIWNTESGDKLFTLNSRQVGGPIHSVAISPDGKRIACVLRPSLNAAQVKIVDVQTGAELKSLAETTILIRSLDFSPDGKSLVGCCTSGPDKGGPMVKVWDAETGQELRSLPGGLSKVTFSGDAKRVASGGMVWDLASGRDTLNFEGAFSNIAFSRDGNRLATASRDGNVKVWNAHTGDELLSFEGHHGNNDVAFSPDGNLLACGGPNGTIKIYDATPLPEKP